MAAQMNEMQVRVLLRLSVGEAMSAEIVARKLTGQRRLWSRRQSTSASLERRVEAERRTESLVELERWIRLQNWSLRKKDGWPTGEGGSSCGSLEGEQRLDPEPSPAAGWYQDPSGRFGLRFWDGKLWTEHFARAGAQFVDRPVAVVSSDVAGEFALGGNFAGWYQDPSGRFHLRYWDGNLWTEQVARSGCQYTDPPIA